MASSSSSSDVAAEIRDTVLRLSDLAEREDLALLAQALRVAAQAADEETRPSRAVRDATLLIG